MSNNFITNNNQHKTLKGRLNTLISISDELKFLVGFFYFSGWQEVYQRLQANPTLKLKLLVGLQVDQMLGKMVIEHGQQEEGLSQNEIFDLFMQSLGFALNNEEMDKEVFYNQVQFFLEMLEEERLIIRKTKNPNHAKLYLFRLNEDQAQKQGMPGQFVTGSSNLTKAGLSGQEEFNVEIKDYGFNAAETYFDELWETAVPITEVEDRRKWVLEFVKHRSQAASVEPFEAYTLILKTYLELQEQKKIRPEVEGILEEIGFKKYTYQLDAVNQALSIIEEYQGVIIADVVGLGKSVIASLIAKNLGKRGMVICPPGLIGSKELRTGWWGYIEDFRLYDWEVESRGRLEEIAETIQHRDIEVVIVDEAHYFRNQDTTAYEALLNICKGKQVILLSATPFNNSPADIFSLLKLFIVPGKSGITLEDNLEGRFRAYNYRFKNLSFIMKSHQSAKEDKRKKAERLYIEYLGRELPIDLNEVKEETKRLANQIRSVISSVVIRRNRLDLKTDKKYSGEVDELSEVLDPKELFYELSEKQANFYDRVLYFFSEEGPFTGAIYQPFSYENAIDEDNLDEQGNRSFQQQRNLFDFMRRLLVKRFESSFGAFSKSINRFLEVHKVVRQFIFNSGGKYILDRSLIEKIYTESEEEIDKTLVKFEQDLLDKKTPKNNTVYNINRFEFKDDFIAHIDADIKLLEGIKDEVEKLDLVNQDPKRECVLQEIESILVKETPKRKLILFSEYVDTVNHLEGAFREKLGSRVLVCDGTVTKTLARHLNENFNAQHKGNQEDHFDVLITSDKLAEGFNLNRAGAIINYDIPWNPTKVIQRVGRINRIGAKVFDELLIFNFFPSEVGADHVKSREIAQQKMFMIHNALGEDSKIFDANEIPDAARLYKRINTTPDDEGEINTSTLIRNQFFEIQEKHPEVIEKIEHLPYRVKTAKSYDINELNILRKKGLSLFAQRTWKEIGKVEIESIDFESLLPSVKCFFEEPRLKLSEHFWPQYEIAKNFKPVYKAGKSIIALEQKAIKNIKLALRMSSDKDDALLNFMRDLEKDIKKYQTLSTRSLGRLGRKEVKRNHKDSLDEFIEEVIWLRNHLGSDYLQKIIEKVKDQKVETIIAVENQMD